MIQPIHESISSADTSLQTADKATNVPQRPRIRLGQIVLLATLLVAACWLQTWAAGFDTPVTMNLTNVHLKRVFKEIQQQTNCRFIYCDEQLGLSKPVTIVVNKVSVYEVLLQAFRNQPLDYTMVDSTVVVKRR